MNATLYDPSDVANLAKLVQDDDQVSIEGPPDLFAQDATEAKSAKAAARDEALEAIK